MKNNEFQTRRISIPVDPRNIIKNEEEILQILCYFHLFISLTNEGSQKIRENRKVGCQC